MSAVRKWWAICGSDPAWWLLLPVMLLVIAVCGPFWAAARAIRRLDDLADWLDDVGLPAVEWLGSVYGPRRERRVQAWLKATKADEE